MLRNYIKEHSALSAILLLIAINILLLLPFVDKAFHLDDPVYIWIAKHIQSNIFDFHGFSINWSGVERPLTSNINPPLLSYYLAFVAYWFGFGEIPLHLSLLIPSCAGVIGTYLLAREFCSRPFMAALISLCTPVYLLSSTTVMPDILMLSFWIYSVLYWRLGIKQNDVKKLVWASLLISACCFTKYIGMNLIPLLFAYSLAEQRKLGPWTAILLIPVLLLGAFNWLTAINYGNGQIANAGAFALFASKLPIKTLMPSLLSGLAFLGGCLLAPLFYTVIICPKRLLIAALVVVSILLVLLSGDMLSSFPIAGADGINWLFVVQLPVFVVAGVCFVYVACADMWKERNPDSLLLFLWVMGSIVFAVFVNWSVNGRSILPIVPVTGILLMRYWERIERRMKLVRLQYVIAPVIPACLIALLVTMSDYCWARSAREAANVVHRIYSGSKSNIWFEGHFGFQYYIQQLGGIRPLDFEQPNLKIGDIVIVPSNNSNILPIYKHMASYMGAYQFDTFKFLATMNSSSGAGFYSTVAGPLPYAISMDTTEKYYVYKMIINKNSRFNY